MKRPHVTPFNPDIAKVVRVASEPTPMARGGCMVNMFDPEGRKVVVQTPALRAPFGVSDYQGKLSLSLSCTPETEETLRALDRAVIQLVVENYPAWFRTSIDEATARSFFLSNLKDDARGRYAPTWRLPIPMYGQKCQMDVFDASRDEIQVKDIAKGNSAIVIVELVGLWFVDKKSNRDQMEARAGHGGTRRRGRRPRWFHRRRRRPGNDEVGGDVYVFARLKD